MTGSDSIIVLDGAHKSFEKTKALDGLSFSVTRGEMFGVIGPDGAGKTTTLRLICGLLAADEGSVRVLGADPFRSHRIATSSIGYVSQRFSLYGDLTIDENIAFFARIHGVADFVQRRTRLLELTGLLPFRERLAERLSGGMKQKLALACTLVHEPPILVLDEPTTGVDPVSRREFWKLLAEFLSRGLTIVFATPYLDEAERCGRVVLLNQGRALALDRPSALQAASEGVILEIVATPARRALQILRDTVGGDRVQLFGDRVHARVPGEDAGRQLRSALEAQHIAVAGMRAITPTLEDVFIEHLARARGSAAAAGTATR
jgi:ABC-2 type transport system ATP-binding protein